MWDKQLETLSEDQEPQGMHNLLCLELSSAYERGPGRPCLGPKGTGMPNTVPERPCLGSKDSGMPNAVPERPCLGPKDSGMSNAVSLTIGQAGTCCDCPDTGTGSQMVLVSGTSRDGWIELSPTSV